MVKKLALVEIDEIKRHQQQSIPPLPIRDGGIVSIEEQMLRDLDKEMIIIMNDANIPISEKVRKYGNALSRFVNLNQENKSNAQPTTLSPPVSTDEIMPGSFVHEFLLKLPSKRFKESSTFFQDLQNNTRIQYNKDGEIIVDGVKLPNSNIIKLIDYYSIGNKSHVLKPEHYDNIFDILRPGAQKRKLAQSVGLPQPSTSATSLPPGTPMHSGRSLRKNKLLMSAHSKSKNQKGSGIMWTKY